MDFGERIEEIRGTVGSEKAVVALSGGVDSSVVAKLAWEALDSEQLQLFTIDDGLRRSGEPEWVVKIFSEMGIPVELIGAQDKFFQNLAPLVDAQARRRVFSLIFGEICGEVAKTFGAPYAFFGTNALDLEETQHGGQKQHNAWGAVGIDTTQKFGFGCIEPIKDLFKDKIRILAETLNLPQEIAKRIAFPGPGLAIRMAEAVTPEDVCFVRQATWIVERNLLPLAPFQCLAFLMTDQATTRREEGKFGRIISVRCVDSDDGGKTTTCTEIPKSIEGRLIGELLALPWIARVVFDKTPKPPGRIEYM